MRTGIETQANGLGFDQEVRRYNDTVTWLAEVLPGAMRTPFEYAFDGSELYATDGSALRPIFDDAITQAESFSADRSYEIRRRLIEREEYDCMIAMMNDELPNTMVVVSDFPAELMEANEDVGGYNVRRKQTMLRVLTKTPQGTLQMSSQSLDKSDRYSLEAIYAAMGAQVQDGELLGQRMHLQLNQDRQAFLVDEITGVYDRALASRYGGNWYAGLPRITENTYEFVSQQTDLLNAYLATSVLFGEGSREYGLAAAMRDRYLGITQTAYEPQAYAHQPQIVAATLALEEMNFAAIQAKKKGDTFSGCGASFAAKSSGGVEEELGVNGYGNRSKEEPEDKYGSLKFKCQKGHENTRPRNKLIPKCKTCGISVAC